VHCALFTTVTCAQSFNKKRLSASGRRCGTRSYHTAIIYWIILLHPLVAAWACNSTRNQSTDSTSPLCRDAELMSRRSPRRHHLRKPRSSRGRAVSKAPSRVLSQTTFDTIQKMLETESMLNNRYARRRSSTTAMLPLNRPNSKASSRTVVRSTHHMLMLHRSLKSRGNILAGARSLGIRSHPNLSDKANARSILSNPSSVSNETTSREIPECKLRISVMKTLQHRWLRSYGPCQWYLARAREVVDVVCSP
jgi:hypothetical protein